MAADYAPLVLRWNQGNAVRLADVAEVVDSVQDVAQLRRGQRQARHLAAGVQAAGGQHFGGGAAGARRCCRSSGLHPPEAIDITIVSDRTPTLRASLVEVERALALAVGLVILVVFFVPAQRARHAHSQRGRARVAGGHLRRDVPGGLHAGQPPLMALTVVTGFVVDDAIVVLENIMRHMERGMGALEAALRGSREMGFTVVSMSLSLIAVFVPIWFMGGIVGRFFREFAVVMAAAILVSMVVSLTTTPMMCAQLLRQPCVRRSARRVGRALDALAARVLRGYRRSLAWCLRHRCWCCWRWLASSG